MDRPPFVYAAQARTPRAVLTVAIVVVLIVIAWVVLDAHPIFVLLGLGLASLAIFDLGRNPQYQFFSDDWGITTDVAGAKVKIAWGEVEHIRITTRLDFTARVTAHLKSGEKHRFHPGVTPPAAMLEAELDQRGIPFERRHFTFSS